MAGVEDRRAILADYGAHGHAGFAWAARRELLARHGFYDCQILGNGDFVMAHAMFGDEDFWNGRHGECKRLSQPLLRHIVEWSRRLYTDVRDSVSYVPGRVLHLWHGDQRDRLYDRPLTILTQSQFDPRTDLVRDPTDCWAWGSHKPALHEWARGYFSVRRED